MTVLASCLISKGHHFELDGQSYSDQGHVCAQQMLLEYARFLLEECGFIDEAGEKLRECIKLVNSDSRAIGLYATLLHTHYKDFGLADKYFRQSIKIDVSNTEAILGYAHFQVRAEYHPSL